MGFLDKIKSFFSEEEKKEEVVEEIKIEEIDSFLDEKDKEVESVFAEKVKVLNGELVVIFDKLEEDIGVLTEVDISEKRDDDRLKQIVDLGRKDYVSALEKLVVSLRKGNYEVGKVKEELDGFMKSSAKSHFKATQLVGKEIGEIEKDIRNMRKLEDDFIKGNGELIERRGKIKDLLKKNKEKKSNEVKKEKLVKNMKKLEAECLAEENSLESLDKEIEEIKKSSEYVERERLIKEKEEKETSLKETEFKFKTLIDSRILSKYAYMKFDEAKTEIAEKYLKDPVKALLEDEDLLFYGVFEDMKDKLRLKVIDVKSSDKIAKRMEIGKEIFEDYKMDLGSLYGDLSRIDSAISEIKIGISDLLEKKEKTAGNVKERKSYLESLGKKKVKIDKVISDIGLELVSLASGI